MTASPSWPAAACCPSPGDYRGWPLYDGRALEAFADAGAAAEATLAGRLRTAGESAAYLDIRRSDFGHLVRSGLLKPADWGHGPFDRRDRFSVPLYRTGDLDDLAVCAALGWLIARSAGLRLPPLLSRRTP